MKIVFMGTPEFAVLPLRTLIENDYNVVAVVTQPDRPQGRKRTLTPSPVKVEAMERGIPVLQPEKIRDVNSVAELQRYAPDLIVTAAYGQILPKSILMMPSLGCINIHASLLPQYRGGAPVHYAIMNGETVSGITIMYMAEGLDTGDMISKVEVPIGDMDNTGTMLDKLSEAGAQLLLDTLPQLRAGTVQAIPQNHEEATYAPTIRRDDERINWQRSAVEIHNQVRALTPEPGAFTLWNGEVLKIRHTRLAVSTEGGNAHVLPSSKVSHNQAPGTVLQCSEDGIAVSTGQGVLMITSLQPAGKKTMDVSQFIRGTRIPEGTVLGMPAETKERS